MNQVFLGAFIPFAVASLVYVRRRFRSSVRLLVVTPFCMILGSLFAVIPDIPRLLGDTSLYRRLASNPRSDFFLWHRSIDLVETESVWYTVGYVLLWAALMLAAWRELMFREKT